MVLFCITSLTYIFVLGHSLLAPLLFSLLMAFLLMPFAALLERKFKFPRSLASVTSVILMLAIIYGILFFLANQLSDLWSDWPALQQRLIASFEDIKQWVYRTFHYNFNEHKELISMDNADKALATSATIVGTTLITLSSSLLFLAFTVLFTFFVLNYRRMLYTFLTQVFPAEHKSKVVEIVGEIQRIIKKYVTGLFLQMLIVSGLMMIVLSIMGIKYAILLGMIAGMFNIIPYLGIATALIISALITLATAGGGAALLVIIAFIGVHAIDGNFLMPVIVGSKVKINALAAFLALIVGEMVWGISGMFLIIPYLAMLKIIFEHIDELKPWALLIGEIQHDQPKSKAKIITKRAEKD